MQNKNITNIFLAESQTMTVQQKDETTMPSAGKIEKPLLSEIHHVEIFFMELISLSGSHTRMNLKSNCNGPTHLNVTILQMLIITTEHEIIK